MAALRGPAAESLALTDPNDVGGLPESAVPAHMYCPAERVVANWHNGAHEGAYATCQEQPCNAVRRVCD